MFLTARASTRHELQFHLFLHSDRPDLVAVCEELVSHGDTIYHALKYNRSASQTWNDGMLETYASEADVAILASDDIWFTEGDLDKLVQAAVENRDYPIILAAGVDHSVGRVDSIGFACFALNPIAIDTVGVFDENFFPACFEDIDYVHRCHGLSKYPLVLPNTNIQHASMGTRRHPDIEIEQKRWESMSGMYFRQKWGVWFGKHEEEEWFPYPFDDERFDFRIAPEVRHNPYPGHTGPGAMQ